MPNWGHFEGHCGGPPDCPLCVKEAEAAETELREKLQVAYKSGAESRNGEVSKLKRELEARADAGVCPFDEDAPPAGRAAPTTTAKSAAHPDPCPECGARLVLRRSQKFGRPFYGCETFPKCRGTAGAHPDGKPLGRAGTTDEKVARRLAHEAFDPLWKRGVFGSRGEAYRALAAHFGGTEVHMGSMTVTECSKVIAWALDAALRAGGR